MLKTLHRLVLEAQHDDLIAWLTSQTLLADEARLAMRKLLDDYQFEALANLLKPLI
jgi:Fe-S cluster biosynthesis and repair protein YggX